MVQLGNLAVESCRGESDRRIMFQKPGSIHCTEIGCKVTQRSVREKFDKLMKDFLKKESEEKNQSGVDVEYGELDQSLQDIKERGSAWTEIAEHLASSGLKVTQRPVRRLRYVR